MPQLDFLLYPSMSLEISFSLVALSYLTVALLPFILPRLVSYELALFNESASLSERNDTLYEPSYGLSPVTFITYTEN
jgi:hypothetical protein